MNEQISPKMIEDPKMWAIILGVGLVTSTDKLCPNCGSPHNRIKYCSDRCKDAYTRKEAKRNVTDGVICPCGKMHINKVYCSRSCRSTYRRR